MIVKKDIHVSVSESIALSGPVQSRPSLFEELKKVKSQVEYEGLARNRNGRWMIDPLYHELCLIMAEMYVTPPERVVRIKGMEMEAGVVQEVYRALTQEHLEQVARNFKSQTNKIHKKTPYLQTSLYNALFELEASAENEYRASRNNG